MSNSVAPWIIRSVEYSGPEHWRRERLPTPVFHFHFLSRNVKSDFWVRKSLRMDLEPGSRAVAV